MKSEFSEFLTRGATHTLTLKPNGVAAIVARPGQELKHRTNLVAMPLTATSGPRLHALKTQVSKMMARVQKKVFGKNWTRRELKDRIYGWAVIEGLPDNGHVHAALVVPAEGRDLFEKLFPASPGGASILWSRWAPGGTTCLDPITTAAGWGEYMSKRTSFDSENWFFVD